MEQSWLKCIHEQVRGDSLCSDTPTHAGKYCGHSLKNISKAIKETKSLKDLSKLASHVVNEYQSQKQKPTFLPEVQGAREVGDSSLCGHFPNPVDF